MPIASSQRQGRLSGPMTPSTIIPVKPRRRDWYQTIEIWFALQDLQESFFVTFLTAPEECVVDIDMSALKGLHDMLVELQSCLPKRPNIMIGVEIV